MIGIFDSGVGGLTVLKSIMDKYPNGDYVYIGDNKNNPYGDKTKEELMKYACRIIDYFISLNINTIVIACNTICSNIFEDLKIKYNNIKFIGVIDSTAKEFINKNKSNVLVIATNKTIDSNIYENKIKNINSNIKVNSLRTPELVPLIEEGIECKEIVKSYLDKYKDIDSIILGCTHYKLIEKYIKNITIVSSSDSVINELDNVLGSGILQIYTTGDVVKFNKLCKKIVNKEASYIDL